MEIKWKRGVDQGKRLFVAKWKTQRRDHIPYTVATRCSKIGAQNGSLLNGAGESLRSPGSFEPHPKVKEMFRGRSYSSTPTPTPRQARLVSLERASETA